MHVRACVRALIIVLKWHRNFGKKVGELLYMLCPSSVGWVIHFSPAIGRYLSVPGDGATRGNVSVYDITAVGVLMVNEISNLGRTSRAQWKVRLACLLHPWSRVLLEKLTGLHPVEKFPAFYGIRRFITTFSSVWHLSLS